ncbi:ABC transporter permease [Haloplasma contractile]|uniref:Peptide ABC transporter permease protein n=1 Tax=Haloplasma contractile SSD-17B TaxID=1033810 RepID=U2EDS3_9MOLU|nr:ABC transporter permease [Haloplasma contractile]ERJ13138.1 Peptide ABC transporter permease protein [Haloplasma contractile SSD-17B]
MLNYILKRLGLMVITATIIAMIVFVMIKLMPTYEPPVIGTDPELQELIRKREGYDKPIPTQFFYWVRNIFVNGDFGWSDNHHKDAIEVLGDRIPISVQVNILPFFVSVPIGFALGMFAALKKNKISDHIISLGVIFFISVPGFVVASLLQYYFAYEWEILPPMLAADIDTVGNPLLKLRSMILPILSLSFGSVATYTRYSRAELTEVLTSEFMLLCRTKGLTRRQATIRHAMRNSLVPLAPMIIGGLIAIFGGSLIIERIFRIPGIGGIYLESFNDRDYSLIMVVILFYTVIGLVSILLVDISYSIIDPRIRVGGGKRG